MIYPHEDIESLGAGIFAVRGSIRTNLLMRISCNMGIVREGSELILVNPIRLRSETERKLMTPENESLESEFLRLLELKFDKLLSAHGRFLEQGAYEALQVAVRSAFSS